MPIKAARKEAQKLHDIIEISRMVVSSLDRDDVLQKILLYARELIDAPACSIALFDEATATMSLHAETGLGADFVARDSWHVAEGGLTRTILQHLDLLLLKIPPMQYFSIIPSLLPRDQVVDCDPTPDSGFDRRHPLSQ